MGLEIAHKNYAHTLVPRNVSLPLTGLLPTPYGTDGVHSPHQAAVPSLVNKRQVVFVSWCGGSPLLPMVHCSIHGIFGGGTAV